MISSLEYIPYRVPNIFESCFEGKLEISIQDFEISKKSLSKEGHRFEGKSLEQLKELESARAPTNRLGTSSTSLGREETRRFRGG